MAGAVPGLQPVIMEMQDHRRQAAKARKRGQIEVTAVQIMQVRYVPRLFHQLREFMTSGVIQVLPAQMPFGEHLGHAQAFAPREAIKGQNTRIIGKLVAHNHNAVATQLWI